MLHIFKIKCTCKDHAASFQDKMHVQGSCCIFNIRACTHDTGITYICKQAHTYYKYIDVGLQNSLYTQKMHACTPICIYIQMNEHVCMFTAAWGRIIGAQGSGAFRGADVSARAEHWLFEGEYVLYICIAICNHMCAHLENRAC
jgi:hypothetical protein